ncbi:HNH endonuclease [Paenibacillus chitinolyticus]|uniref:HNH endonuclease n=1 Tax=Paenibacillus chitinolyticus TaxID=79263 RepID=UPI0036704F76
MTKKIIDLTDKQFGELTVLKKVIEDNKTKWLCRCSCKKEIIVPGYALRAGIYKSCGCIRDQKRDQGAKQHIENDRADGTRKSALKAKLHAGNKSGVKGVIWMSDRQKWRAYIGIKGKSITLGYYALKDDAIAARKAAEEMYHKPYLEDE